MSDETSCPKCGFAREPAAVDCPACGIVYARFRARPAIGGGAGGSLPPPPPASFAPPPSPSGDLYAGDPAGFGPGHEAAAANPYSAPEALVLRPGRPLELSHQPLATRGSRLAARFVDGLILVALVVVPMLLGGGLDLESDSIADAALAFIAIGFLALAGVNLYLLAKNGQTLGKKALRIRIVMLDGSDARLLRIVLVRIIAPNLLGSVPLVGPIFGLANVLWIFGAEQRCLHDHMAGTKVIVA